MFEVTVHGVKAVEAAFLAAVEAERKATQVAIRKSQNRVKTQVRRNLSGAPRWGHRGAGVYEEPVDLGFHNNPRSGPLGRFTGDYRRGVGGKRRIKSDAAGLFVGGVGIGGKKIPQNNFKKHLEAKYPSFEPAVHEVLPELYAIYTAAWHVAWKRFS